MKRMIKCSIIALAGLFMLIACSKDKPIAENNQKDVSEGITLPVTIRVAIPDNLTRVSLTQDAEDADGSVKLAWEEGDKIYVADHANNETWATYVIDTPLGDNPHVATFSLVGDGITASSFDILYGAPSLAMAEGVDFTEQTQEGNANTGHLQYMALISGVSTVDNVQFTADWAAEKGGSFKQSGVVRLRLQMPVGVTTVSSVYLAASSAVFNTNNKLDAKTDMITVNISPDEDVSDDNNIVTVYANLPWADVSVPAETELTAVVKASDGYYYSKAIPNASGVSFTPGSVNAVKLSRTGFGLFAGGEGIDGNPYTISSKWHMMNMMPKMTENAGSTTYFKLLNDINMSGLTWSPLNPTSPYSQAIDFDGDGNTVSSLNASFIYVIKGSVKDLVFDHATIASGSQRGVLSQYIQGTGNVIKNVDISNSTVSGGTNTGALIGRINSGTDDAVTATITDCDIENSSVKASVAGGLIGSVEASVIIDNCTVSNTDSGNYSITGTSSNIGGLVGNLTKASTITDCTVSGIDVKGASVVGGVIGFANALVTMSGCTFSNGTVSTSGRYGGGMIGSTGNYNSVISDCHVEKATIISTHTDDARCGGFCGQIQTKVKVSGCTVGTSSERVVIQLAAPASGKVLNSGGFAGTQYGTVTKNGDVRSQAFVEIQCTNTAASTILGLGGFVGYQQGITEYSDADAVMTGLKGQYIGGFVGKSVASAKVRYCTANATVSGDNLTGGFVGGMGDADSPGAAEFSYNTASGEVAAGSSVGGFAGLAYGGSLTKNSTSCTVSGVTNIGGFVGQMDGSVTVSRCSSSGNATASGNVCGGFVGLARNGVEISDSFTTSNLLGGTRKRGGIAGYVDVGTVSINRCYTTSNISNNFEMGGLVGFVSVETFTMTNCAAWNGTLVASNRASNNWSSAACVGVTYLTCTLTDNYRSPDMDLLAYWGTNSGCSIDLPTSFQHPNVSTSAPLTDPDGNAVTSSTMRPYQGKCEAGKTLSQLASTTLGWSSDVWDFTGDLPTLK